MAGNANKELFENLAAEAAPERIGETALRIERVAQDLNDSSRE